MPLLPKNRLLKKINIRVKKRYFRLSFKVKSLQVDRFSPDGVKYHVPFLFGLGNSILDSWDGSVIIDHIHSHVPLQKQALLSTGFLSVTKDSDDAASFPPLHCLFCCSGSELIQTCGIYRELLLCRPARIFQRF